VINALIGGMIGIFSWLLWSINYEKTMVPDSYQYVSMAQGHKVARPFWGRWLVPFLFREHGYAWEGATLVCVVAMHAGLGWVYGIWAPLLLFPSHLIAWNVRAPIQVDLVPLAILCLSLKVENPWALIGIGLVLGACKQHAPVFLALATWSPWPLIGIAGSLIGWRWRRPVDPEVDKNPWIVSPITTVMNSKRGHWVNPRLMIFPWGLVLPLALMQFDLRLGLTLAAAYAPLVAASDNARVYLWGLPILIGYAVAAPMAPAWWPVIVLGNFIVSVYAAEVRAYTRGGLSLT
jgi:hypothetical protein